MTDVRTTQVSVEEWSSTTPDVRTTQVVIEEWGSVATAAPPPPSQPMITMVM